MAPEQIVSLDQVEEALVRFAHAALTWREAVPLLRERGIPGISIPTRDGPQSVHLDFRPKIAAIECYPCAEFDDYLQDLMDLLRGYAITLRELQDHPMP